MNFSEMKTEVFRRINESAGTPVFWSEADVAAALNDGYEELSDSTEWFEKSNTITLSGSTYYNLSSNTVLTGNEILTPKRAFNPRTNRWLRWTDWRDLDNHTYRQWETVTGEPEQILSRGMWWLGTFPKKSGGTITLWYTAVPQVLLGNSDEPAFPSEFHYALVDYAIYDLLCQEGEGRKAIKFWNRYLQQEVALKQYVQNRLGIDRVSSFH